MDVKTAFLNGLLDMAAFIEPIEGFEDHFGSDNIGELVKGLHGLKQSPRIWYNTFVEFMTSIGFSRTRKERCVFTKVVDDKMVYVSLDVDDLLIFAPTLDTVNDIKRQLNARFHVTDLNEVSYILGWKVLRNRTERTIFLHQTKYTNDVLQRFHMTSETHPRSTPMKHGKDLSKQTTVLSEDDPDFLKVKSILRAAEANMPYRSVVGSLMYLVLGTRPDLAHIVQQLSQYLTSPHLVHYKVARWALQYLLGTTVRPIV